MVTKNKIWVDNEVLTASELNENILQPLSNLDQTDFNELSLTTSDTEKYTIDINAGAISNYVLIRFGLYARGSYGTGGTSISTTGSLKIDTVEKFTASVTGNGGDMGGSVTVGGRSYKNCVFKYTPTNDEKTNGFTISLNAYISSSSGFNEAGATYGWEVWGA